MASQSLVLIDGNNMFYKSFYAVKYSKNAAPQGYNLQRGYLEAHVFLKMFLANVSRFMPAAVLLCWDGNQSAYRQRIYSDYKSKRISAASGRDPAEIKRVAMLRAAIYDLFPKLGLCSLVVNGVEADDLIAYFYRKYHNDYNIVVVSGDSDLKQFPDSLVCDLAGVTHHIDHGTAKLNILRKIVCGDTSDGITGVGGIGPKKFEQLMEECGPTFNAVAGYYSEDMSKIDLLVRNRRLVDLLYVNKVIVNRAARSELNKVFADYLTIEFNRLVAVGHCIKLGLRHIAGTNIASVLEGNYVTTSNFIRRSIKKQEHKIAA